jgi:hypothetical protein
MADMPPGQAEAEAAQRAGEAAERQREHDGGQGGTAPQPLPVSDAPMYRELHNNDIHGTGYDGSYHIEE